LSGQYVTLPNLIVDREVIPELLMHACTVANIDNHLSQLLCDGQQRTQMLAGYSQMAELLGTQQCTDEAAAMIVSSLL